MRKADQIKRMIFQHSGRVPDVLVYAHTQLAFHERQKFIDWFVTTPFKHFYLPAILPKKHTDIKYIHRRVPAMTLDEEFERLAHIILLNIDRIHRYLEFERVIVSAILKGNYLEAQGLIAQVSNEVCASFWSLEAEFHCRFLKEGIIGVRTLRRNLSQINRDLLFDLFGYITELKFQPEISARALVREHDELLKVFRQSSHPMTLFVEYFLFGHEFDHADLREPIKYTWWLPLIDQYRVALRMATSLALTSSPTASVIDAVSKVADAISDPRWNMVRCWATKDLARFGNSADLRLMRMLDAYTVGDTVRSAALASELLDEKPTNTTAIEILTKLEPHVVEARLSSWLPEHALLARIIRALNQLYFGDRPLEIRIDAVQLIASMSSMTGLSDFIKQFVKNRSNDAFHTTFARALLATDEVTPRMVSQVKDHGLRKTFLDAVEQSVGAGQTLETMRYVFADPKSKIHKLPQGISDSRKALFEACRLEEIGDHAGAAKIFHTVVAALEGGNTVNKRSLAEAYRSLFRTAVRAGNNLEALQIALRSYELAPEIFLQLGVEYLLAKAATSTDQQFLSDIRLPIVGCLWHADGKKVYQLCDMFLSRHGCKFPTELKILADNFSRAELILFLSKACTLDVLSNNFWLESTEELENERIDICRWICDLAPSNSAAAKAEIATIARNSAIRKGVQRIDQSRIYVNTEGITRKLGRILRESHGRIHALRSLPADEQEKLIDPAALYQRIIDEAQKSEGAPILLVTDPAFPVFEKLFAAVRDEFAGSGEFGLDSYLGVRIRHGTLLGQLRRAFAQADLVTAKTESGLYIENVKWKDRLGLPNWIWLKVSEELNQLSRFVDQSTIQIKDTWIKVRALETETSGLFDFSFSRSDLYFLYKTRSKLDGTTEDLITAIYDALWQRTSQCLQVVRHKITTEAQVNFVKYINDLEAKIRDISDKHGCDLSELSRAIALCRTNVQTDFEKVAAWFSLPQGLDDADTILDDAAQTAAAIVRRLYPARDFHPAVQVEAPNKIRSRFLVPIVDIIQILLDNIIRHSGLSGDELGASLKISFTGDRLVVICENNVADASKLKHWLEKHPLPSDWSEVDLEASNREERSGLYKLAKIARNDLAARHLSIRPTFTEGAHSRLIMVVDLCADLSA